MHFSECVHTGKPAHQQRQRVGEDRGEQRPVDLRNGAVGGPEDRQPRHDAGDQVGDEDPSHAEVGGEQPGGAEPEGQRHVQNDVHGFQPHERHGPALFAQPREGDAGPDVEKDDQADPDDVFGMRDIRLAHHAGDAVAEKGRRQEEHRRGERRDAR